MVGSRVPRGRSNPRSREIPKGSRYVRNSVLSLQWKLRQSNYKRDTELRYVGKSHVACLLIMFVSRRLAMPPLRRENVRHATLLFCAEGVNVRAMAWVKEGKMKKIVDDETKGFDSEKALSQHFMQKLKELGIDGKYIRQEYSVWTGNGVQYKVDVVVMDDNDIPHGLFEVRFIGGNDEKEVVECISKMESLTKNVVPCFAVICQKGGKPLLYQLNDSGARECYDLDIELPHVCKRINPTENIIKSVGDYLAAIKRAKAALNMRQGEKGLFSHEGKVAVQF